ncbi:uncharacterized protein N7458_005773 [Penicillium daleae]|uniref:Uncharacterized protein n=1 Tax=Penicillium daleae TaxID=63821 RepID=A0AAD6C8P4_9EURO|nr:uncharacterized protein N7458_005773 [Penicillium daleae]KAJ5454817.1 hypothetical protein N7458_005773 [Penicillium daleae]
MRIADLLISTVAVFIISMISRVAAAMVTAENVFRLAGLGSLIAGRHSQVDADAGERDTKPLKEAWGLRSGVYTPRQLVEGFAPLLDTVVFHLGIDPTGSKPARTRLLDNVAANLATDSRESTLRLVEPLDISRREMKDQANRIGKTLVQWARESSPNSFDPEMYLRSPCEGHLLLPSNVDLMFGDRAAPHLMQLFNEYMHQMVLLRDALLPFQNYQDVLIPVDRQARGIRHLESARSQFLAELLTKHTTQKGIIAYAKALLAPGLLHNGAAGYGFQYAHGTVLPAFLAGGPTPLHLLQYLPTKIDESVTEVLFEYKFQDYYSAPRGQIPKGSPTSASLLQIYPETKSTSVESAAIGMSNVLKVNSSQLLKLQLELSNGKCISVDLGQIARGHRYSYLIQNAPDKNITKFTQDYVVHDPLSILQSENGGLLTVQEGGVHVFPVEDPLIALALLGKLYPENVVLLPADETLCRAETAGKGFEPKFVVWGGSKRGGLKGVFEK